MYETLKISLPKNGSNTYWSIISRIDFVLIKTVGIYIYICYCRKCTRIHGNALDIQRYSISILEFYLEYLQYLFSIGILEILNYLITKKSIIVSIFVVKRRAALNISVTTGSIVNKDVKYFAILYRNDAPQACLWQAIIYHKQCYISIS